MSDVVVFDPDGFRKLHAYFENAETYPDELLQSYFDRAVIFVGNDDDSLFDFNLKEGVKDRAIALDYVTCHLATLGSRPDGFAGRLSGATEGSVSTSFDLVTSDDTTDQWWLQTNCGAAYLVMLKSAARARASLYATRQIHPYG